MGTRTVAMALVLAVVSSGCIVYDAAVTAKNSVTAGLKQLETEMQKLQRQKLGRMARRLSIYTDLSKYSLPDPPRWRTHGGDFLYAEPFNEALIFGDPAGAAYLALSHPVAAASASMQRLPPSARRIFESRLATVEAADAAVISATNDTGQLRLNGRKRELAAIEALDALVIDPSSEQSATAVLDKISGAATIGARQRQARAQLLVGIVEQLVLENKRSRDSEAEAVNMQLTTWRNGRAAGEAFVAGSGDALRTWRQP